MKLLALTASSPIARPATATMSAASAHLATSSATTSASSQHANSPVWNVTPQTPHAVLHASRLLSCPPPTMEPVSVATPPTVWTVHRLTHLSASAARLASSSSMVSAPPPVSKPSAQVAPTSPPAQPVLPATLFCKDFVFRAPPAAPLALLALITQ